MCCSKAIIPLLAALVVVSAPCVAPAVTINVPGDVPDIQSGLNLADNGDTVLVAPGTYSGDGNRALDFGGVDISLIGTAGSDLTIIDLTYDDFGFIFQNGEPPSALLQGFTIMHADSMQGANAIDILNGASPTISDCRITGNKTEISGPYGIVRVQDGFPFFENCVVDYNNSVEADGIVVVTGGGPWFHGCVMAYNKTTTSCLYASGGQVLLTQSQISLNDVQNGIYGGAVLEMISTSIFFNAHDGARFLTGFSSTMDSCSVIANGGTGIIIEGNDTVIQNSDIKGNLGGGIKHQSVNTSGSVPYVYKTVISGNVNTSSPGGGILMDCTNVPTAPFSPIYDHCTITGNSSAFDGGGIAVCGNALYVDITPVFVNCTISANLAGGSGGGLLASVESLGFDGLITMDHTILWGNCANGVGEEIFAGPDNAVEITCSDIDTASTGAAGEGYIGWGSNTVFADPAFCLQPACDPLGTIAGDFGLSAESPVDSANSPCHATVGANPVCPTSTGVTGNGGASMSAGSELLQNYPNPFNPVTTIRFDLVRAGHVELSVYDVRGRLVQNLVNSDMVLGEQAVVWKGRNSAGNPVAAGIYFAVLRTTRETLTRKMVLIK